MPRLSPARPSLNRGETRAARGASQWPVETGTRLRHAPFPRTCRHRRMERPMNWDQIAGNWKQFAGKAKERWGKLTDSDWSVIEGKRDQLVGRIQERYGIAKDEAERQVAEYESSYEHAD